MLTYLACQHLWAQMQRNLVLFTKSALCKILLQLFIHLTQLSKFGPLLATVGSFQHNSAT